MAATGTAHLILGAASLALGAAIFTLRKGTELHRLLGALYVLCLFGLNLTALLIYRIFGGFGVFHVLSLLNLAMVLGGFAAVLLKRPRLAWLRWHYYLMGWSYVGLCAAAVSEVTARVPGWPFWPAVGIPTAIVAFAGGGLLQAGAGRVLAGVKQPASGGSPPGG